MPAINAPHTLSRYLFKISATVWDDCCRNRKLLALHRVMSRNAVNLTHAKSSTDGLEEG